MYFLSCPFILSIIAWTGGYHGDTEGPFLIGCQDEVRVTGESRDQTLPGLILVSPVSPVSTFTFVGLFSLLPQLISTAICYRSLIDSYSNPKYLQLCQHAGFKCGPKKPKTKHQIAKKIHDKTWKSLHAGSWLVSFCVYCTMLKINKKN